ncbi:hypothetical protein [Herbaspirillum sp. ST 5-3]|uniref:tetratricopeptide repeat protein n=1 Tax=Oxalobacteraceae TaxID=75682 RepID=UPI001FFF8737|nr:hypothetical protein [Herbaspirillum sp. ST 5-3]
MVCHFIRQSGLLFCALLLTLLLTLIAAAAAQAAPFIPRDGNQVLERLPQRNDPLQRELRALRKAVAADPRNLPLAAQLAHRYIEAGRKEGDPRYLGYAQAVLTPWWNQPQPPVEVQLLRATLLQSTHHFDAALVDLHAVLQADHSNAQAWLTQATILQVQGKFDLAKASCARLYALAPELITVTCIANLASLTGQADKGYALLQSTLDRNPGAAASIRNWARTLLAEIAERRGNLAAAEQAFREMNRNGDADAYLLGAYADFLLDQQRPREVLPLLKNHLRVDALLLRYAEALKQIDSPDAAAHIALLSERFKAARLRGDTVHQREQARFELHLLNDPKSALHTARRNWEAQKEPADVRILLAAAIAAHDRQTVHEAHAWLAKTGLQDRKLTSMLQQAGVQP